VYVDALLTVITGNITAMPGTDKRERDEYLHVKLSSEEKTQLRVQAAQRDLTMSEYIRELILGEDETVPA